MERLISLQAGPFWLDVYWRRQGAFRGMPTLEFFRRERHRKCETLEIHLLPTLAELEPPGVGANLLVNEWSSEELRDGSSRVLFWCAKSRGYVLEARFNKEFSRVEVRALRSFHKHQHLNFLLTSVTRWMVLHRLAITGGFMLHGAGVSKRSLEGHSEEIAWIGTGPSGAGKSTFSSFFMPDENYEVLSDETVILRRNQAEWEAWGTPWPGMLSRGRNIGARLNSVFFLEKTTSHEWREISSSAAFARIWSEVYVPPASQELARRTLACVEALIAERAPRVLGFRKDHGVVNFVDSMRQAGAVFRSQEPHCPSISDQPLRTT